MYISYYKFGVTMENRVENSIADSVFISVEDSIHLSFRVSLRDSVDRSLRDSVSVSVYHVVRHLVVFWKVNSFPKVNNLGRDNGEVGKG